MARSASSPSTLRHTCSPANARRARDGRQSPLAAHKSPIPNARKTEKAAPAASKDVRCTSGFVARSPRASPSAASPRTATVAKRTVSHTGLNSDVPPPPAVSTVGTGNSSPTLIWAESCAHPASLAPAAHLDRADLLFGPDLARMLSAAHSQANDQELPQASPRHGRKPEAASPASASAVMRMGKAVAEHLRRRNVGRRQACGGMASPSFRSTSPRFAIGWELAAYNVQPGLIYNGSACEHLGPGTYEEDHKDNHGENWSVARRTQTMWHLS